MLAGCAIFTSCKTDLSSSNRLSLIPADASVVLEIDGKDIIAKSGLNHPDDYKFFNLISLAEKEGADYLKHLLKGSKEAGINIDNTLVYVTQFPSFAMIVPVVDKSAFEQWLKKFESPEPVVDGEISYIVEHDLYTAWNDHLLILSENASLDQLKARFSPQEKGLLATNDDFKHFADRDADMRLWLRYSSLIDVYKNIGISSISSDKNSLDELPFDIHDFDNISVHSYLDFKNGQIEGKAEFYPASEVDKLKKKYPIFKEQFDTEILKDMPEQSYLAFNVSINVKEYVSLMRQNFEKMLSSRYTDQFDIYEHSAELFEFLDSPEFQSVVDALAGDMLLDIHGFNKGLITYPLISADFTVNGESAFINILNLLPKDLYQKEDQYYKIAADKSPIPVYFGYKNNRVFVSNDIDAIKQFIEGRKGKTLADSPVGKMMTNKMVFYINLNYATYPENIAMLIQNSMGSSYKLFTSAIEIYEGMYFAGKEYSMDFSLQLKNKEVNSLKQILTNIDQTFLSAWTK
jgi:hypothetical protein